MPVVSILELADKLEVLLREAIKAQLLLKSLLLRSLQVLLHHLMLSQQLRF